MNTSTSVGARDYDQEARDHAQRRYSYGFDEQMHHYMMRTWQDELRDGSALELGCFHGHFTGLLCERFGCVDVVDASAQCIEVASRRAGPQARFFQARFEQFEPDARYDNIFLVHTLEHLDDPVGQLARFGSWLGEGGRLFVATPNARAPSRQIAVHMGLIEHLTAVTPAERAHGHRTTYTLDMLHADARKAGLHVSRHGGVCFKPLANFQIDAALAAGIVSTQYLDACFEVGRTYPELCASIYLVCERDSR